MSSTDRQVLEAVRRWARDGHRLALITVARTWGLAPRPAGYWMALREDGQVQGSVSGGCIEADLIERVRSGGFASTAPFLMKYGVTQDEARRFGLPCGGTMELVIEPCPDLVARCELSARIERGQLVKRTITVGQVGIAVAPGTVADDVSWNGQTLTTVHGPAWRLLIVGAGQISTYLAQMAPTLGYQIFVCDPRSEYTAEWGIPETTLLTCMPDDAVIELNLDPHSAASPVFRPYPRGCRQAAWRKPNAARDCRRHSCRDDGGEKRRMEHERVALEATASPGRLRSAFPGIYVGGVDIAVEKALEHVFGYAVGLDMTRRDLQLEASDKGRPWEFGKSFAKSAPIGMIYPADVIGHPQSAAITLTVNGTSRQSSDIEKLIWSVAESIAYLSEYEAIEPGDIIMTGILEGVNAVKPGDELRFFYQGHSITTTCRSRTITSFRWRKKATRPTRSSWQLAVARHRSSCAARLLAPQVQRRFRNPCQLRYLRQRQVLRCPHQRQCVFFFFFRKLRHRFLHRPRS